MNGNECGATYRVHRDYDTVDGPYQDSHRGAFLARCGLPKGHDGPHYDEWPCIGGKVTMSWPGDDRQEGEV